MSDKEFVWVIEVGDYSDYRVVGVYDTEEKAIKVARLIGHEDSVAKWALNPGIDDINAGRHPYRISMNFDGSVNRLDRVTDISDHEIRSSLRIWKKTEAPFWKNRPISDSISGIVWASDDNHAAKIANEFRTQQIALGNMKSRELNG